MSSVTPEAFAAAPLLAIFLERKAVALHKCRVTSGDCAEPEQALNSGVTEVYVYLFKNKHTKKTL